VQTELGQAIGRLTRWSSELGIWEIWIGQERGAPLHRLLETPASGTLENSEPDNHVSGVVAVRMPQW
jgi:hypothetical protein